MRMVWRQVKGNSLLGKRDICDLWVDDGHYLVGVAGFIYEDHDGRLTFVTYVGDPMGRGRHRPPVSDLEDMKTWAEALVRLKLANGETV